MLQIYFPLSLQVEDLILSTFLFAYLDPGSGSYILQLIIAGFAGLLYAFRGYWATLISTFRKPPSDSNTDNSETDDTEQ